MISGTVEKKFKPAWWLPEGHTQTLWRKFTAFEQVLHRRERLELSDGDFIDIDWCEAPSQTSLSVEPSSGIVVIVHGLCGCSSSPYVVALQKLLAKSGKRSVAMNFRGCSGQINNLARAYHSGVSEDLEEVYKSLIATYPNEKFMFVGYSLGANVLLKWLGEQEPNDRITKAVAVSTPFQLGECSKAMLKGPSRFYGSYFVNRLRNDVITKMADFRKRGLDEEYDTLASLGDLDRINSLMQFDDLVTAPLHGFENADDYYKKSSSAQFLKHINTDTLLIQSKNDPLIPASALPSTTSLSASVRMELSSKGGHVGFISGDKENWLEKRITDHLIA